ncbi:MAG: CPBP family intramembrane metalloprotease [Lentisphaerae bacterium]|nr:CPBP family intramembrane metalloprotease [Lentisphaerota bacterium]MCP4101539.1 CPBP family intramembrane metalloprotease [Lentisphaerota bacterium]
MINRTDDMLTLWRNSYKKNDAIVGSGFMLSMIFLCIMIFILPPLLYALGCRGMSISCPCLVLLAMLPPLSFIIAVTLTLSSKYGFRRMLRGMKLLRFRFSMVISCGFTAVALMFFLAPLTIVTKTVIEKLGFPVEEPVFVQLLQQTSGPCLWALIFTVIVIAPIAEELMFRRFIFGFLAPYLGFVPAMVFTAGLFAAVHSSLLQLPALFLLGIAFQMSCLYYRSLWGGIILHSINNAISVTVLLLGSYMGLQMH